MLDAQSISEDDSPFTGIVALFRERRSMPHLIITWGMGRIIITSGVLDNNIWGSSHRHCIPFVNVEACHT